MIVVVDSGPLILLAQVHRLDLLRGLFQKVLIPDAVYHEVVERGADRPGAIEVAGATWIEVVSTDALGLARELDGLGAGERAALMLAIDRHADLVVCDDRRGRRTAVDLGLTVTGTLGVLLLAHRRGLLDNAATAIRQVVASGLRISDQLLKQVLEGLGESATEE